VDVLACENVSLVQYRGERVCSRGRGSAAVGGRLSSRADQMANERQRMPPPEGLSLHDASLVGSGSFIDGAFCNAGSRKVIVANPANGGVVSTVISATAADVERYFTSLKLSWRTALI
jgi:hypothetical protein